MKPLRSFFLIASLAGSAVAADPKNDADNTARNKQDKPGNTATAFDQSNTAADIKLVATIRHAVVNENSLSTTAKNCKIITSGGKVILRGPVKTEAEKTTIENHATNAAGKGNVDNQLEVKAGQ